MNYIFYLFLTLHSSYNYLLFIHILHLAFYKTFSCIYGTYRLLSMVVCLLLIRGEIGRILVGYGGIRFFASFCLRLVWSDGIRIGKNGNEGGFCQPFAIISTWIVILIEHSMVLLNFLYLIITIMFDFQRVNLTIYPILKHHHHLINLIFVIFST